MNACELVIHGELAMSRLHRLTGLGQSVWIDFLSRDLLDSGGLARAVTEVDRDVLDVRRGADVDGEGGGHSGGGVGRRRRGGFLRRRSG